jgi:hypothetical protein
MVVGDDELDAREAAGDQAAEEVAPGRAALAGRELDREDLPPALPVDADGDVHGLGAHDAALAHPLVPGIEDEVGEGLVQPARGEGREAGVERLVDLGDRAGREGVSAQLLGDRLHLPRRDTLDVHLREAGDERLLRALVAGEELGREAAIPVLGHPQLQLADAGHQRARVGARAIAAPGLAPLALRGAERVRHLGLQHLLERGAHDLP